MSLVSSIRVITSVTGSGIGIECIADALLEYKNLYVVEMLEPVAAIVAIFIIYQKLLMTIKKKKKKNTHRKT
jgi:hypothetical protein